MELCTAEEAHVVCLLPTVEAALAFSAYIRETLPPVRNRPDIFGEQWIVDEEDHVTGREELLLTTASSIGVEQILPLVRSYGGTAFSCPYRPALLQRDGLSGDILRWGFLRRK